MAEAPRGVDTGFQSTLSGYLGHVDHMVQTSVGSKLGKFVGARTEQTREDALFQKATHYLDAQTNLRGAEPQWFLTGATTTCILRAEAIPGRVFHGFDAKTEVRPWDVMQSAGLNAIRVQTWMNADSKTCASFDNSGNVLQREMDFQLDPSRVDIQVKAAQLAKARNMKIIHNVNLGGAIPDAWLGYSYVQMLDAIDAEMQDQVAPFLESGIQPDIVLLENEGTSGVLFEIKLPNSDTYHRGVAKGDGTSNPNVPLSQLYQEVSGHLPTGHIFAYPQLAGYMKQQILSIRRAIHRAGFDDTRTRFGIHSHVQFVDWKQGITFSSDNNNELTTSVHNKIFSFENVIPDYILTKRASDMLEIMGFSSYPAPMTPKDPSSNSSMQDSLARNRTTLELMDKVAQRYGKHTNGHFKGQYKKQALAVEYTSAFNYPEQIQYQQEHTHIYLTMLKSYPWMLGTLW